MIIVIIMAQIVAECAKLSHNEYKMAKGPGGKNNQQETKREVGI